MKRLPKSLHSEFQPVKLWAEDLREIIEALGGDSEVNIRSESLEYDSISEFLEERKGRRTSDLMITSDKLSIRVELSTSRAAIFCSSNDHIKTGAFHTIDGILRRCERKPKFLYSYAWSAITTILLQIAYQNSGPTNVKEITDIAAPLSAIWLVFVTFFFINRTSTVIPLQKDAEDGFFKRNKDTIIIGLMCAVAGAAATKAADRIWPSPQPTAEQHGKLPASENK